MTYANWVESHAHKHASIMKTLTQLNDDEIIDYFVYENMQENHPDFCPLYADNKKCHEMEVLNCYLCACPHFRFSDEGLFEEAGKMRYSLCSIKAKESRDFVSETAIHLDCSACLLPHRSSFIKKHFSHDWCESMKDIINLSGNKY